MLCIDRDRWNIFRVLFIRKHGDEDISYDLPEMQEYLEETYGITVYQEQVMLLSQKLADFTKGEADILRKAMGKKKKDVLAELKPKYINQATAKGFAEETLKKSGKTGKLLPAMRSINLILLVTPILLTKRLISKPIIRQNIWRLCCLTT